MGKARALVAATHPLPAAAVTAFTLVVAVAAGAPGRTAVLLAAAVLAGQASIGWSNDFADRHRDRAAGRTDKPLARGELADRTVGGAAVVALAACVPLSLAVGVKAGLAHCVVVTAAWAYNLGLKGTAASPVPYAIAFALLPPWVVASSLPGAPAPRTRLVVASAVLGVSAHFANTVADADADRRTGVRGLPQRLGPVWSARTSVALLVVAALALLGLPAGGLGRVAAGAALAVSAGYGLRLAGPRPPLGRRTFALHLATVALLLAAFVAAGTELTAG